ncbi:MAG: tyrosine-type recombinase/integrase [Halorhabdus sp.]
MSTDTHSDTNSTDSEETSSDDRPKKIEGITVVPEPTRERLKQKQLSDYWGRRENLIQWMLTIGKNPDRADGYATGTARGYAFRIDRFLRWVWDREGQYTTTVTHSDGDDWMQHLAFQTDKSADAKSSCQKALKVYFRWRASQLGGDEWDPEMTFSTDNGTTNPPDYFTQDEREQLRDTALNYGSVPHYKSLSPEERSRWKAHLAQRFGKPKSDIGPDDFARANSWKVTSLVWVSLDTGLRPIEVERSRVQWLDLENGLLRIPATESSKNKDHWKCALTDRTVDALEKWLREREQYDKYDGRDDIWLTREGNPYQSESLQYLLEQLCDEANISTDNRQISWYTIRHSVGTGMSRERGLEAARAQLRHRTKETTMRYDSVPTTERRDALDRMG